MKLLIAFGTNDGRKLNNEHVGMAEYYYIYEFNHGGKEVLVEKRRNVKFKGDETIKHGDPQKAMATTQVLRGVDVIVGRKFGPNITRLLKKFVCVVSREANLDSAIEAVHAHMDQIIEERERGPKKKHITMEA